MGYENIRLIDTTDGVFMTKKEAAKYSLKHSAIFFGKRRDNAYGNSKKNL
jgi:hypothetical protein